MPALRIERLATALIGPIDLEVGAGECVAVMGASGSGKSLLLRAIVDLDPSTGNIWCGDRGRAGMRSSEWRKLVSLVPAESGWWDDRVGDHFPSPQCDLDSLVDGLGLKGALDWSVSRLSSGERQRLAIARAICRDPSVLLLDEPTAALDEHAAGQVESLIKRCCEAGKAVLLVTHDRRQVGRVASRTMLMRDGRLQALAGNVA